MKSNKFAKYRDTYEQGLSNIPLGVDGTDHIAFFCPKCEKIMEVISVESKKMDTGEGTDNCTWINLACHQCKRFGQRKFYWSIEDGRFCTKRTDDKHA